MSEQELQERLDRIEAYARMSAKDALDINEAALLTGYSVNYLHQLTSRRRIPHYRQGNFLRFSKKELEAWLLQNRVSTKAETEQEAEAVCERLKSINTNHKRR
ncbi:MAG: helix-turn-helix domain-containing protein [Bacteroidales bacterium]|nr:helix-turn-helix domain-containing protein [Bacteroidales bacterium]